MHIEWKTVLIIGAVLAGLIALIGLIGLALYVRFRKKNIPHRTGPAPDPAGAPIIEATADYTLGFVEFDDQGRFWDDGRLDQKATVLQMIRTAVGLVPDGQARGILLVFFAHGWKNNAAPGSHNVQMFQDTLRRLGQAERELPAPRPVVGVYAGWRGLTSWKDPLMEVTFYERMTTAHKVGVYGGLTELLVDLEALQQQANSKLPDGAPRTELIIVGHSMGAAAIYSAIAQMVTERFIHTIKKEEGQVLKPLGDQVILLNPAFEAARHYNLNRLTTSVTQYPPEQRPVLSIFTSKGDDANQVFFPLGRYLSTWFQSCRDAEQWRSIRSAVGWYPPFVTHDLIYKPHPAAPAAAAGAPTATNSTFNPVTKKHEFHGPKQLRDSIENVRVQRARWHPNNKVPVTYQFDDSTLQPRAGFRPGNPVLIVSLDKQIIKDHNDLTNPALIHFLGEYILFCQKGETPAPAG